MKYVAQFIFPYLGKVDKQIKLDDFKDKILVPLIERCIGVNPLSELDLEYNKINPRFRVMEFIFNGKQIPQDFEPDNKGNFKPTWFLCEYEFNGIKDT